MMCLPKSQRPASERSHFYNVSKHLFYFFVSVYGGGPAIVNNEYWELIEPVFKQIRTAKDDEEETKSSYSRKTRGDRRP